MAGSGIRGAFEEKFKALIRDIEDEVSGVLCASAWTLIWTYETDQAGHVICFIDEVRECCISG